VTPFVTRPVFFYTEAVAVFSALDFVVRCCRRLRAQRVAVTASSDGGRRAVNGR
jgi:hypothetical protein